MRMLKIFALMLSLGCASGGDNEVKIDLKPPVTSHDQETKCKKEKIKNMTHSDVGREHPKAWKKKFNFSFIDIGIREALLDLSEQSGIPIVFDENVNGVITLNVISKNFRDSLRMIVNSGPYDYKYQMGYYFVGLVDPSSPSWSKLAYTYQYRAHSMLPSAVIKMINPIFEPYVTGNDKLRMISIFAPKTILVDLVNMIRQLDQKPRQIKLSMTISELSKNGKMMLGRRNFTGTAIDTITGFSPVAEPHTPVLLKPNAFKNLMHSISFIESHSEGEIKAKPALTVLEGEEAKVKTSVRRLLSDVGTDHSSKPNFVNAEIGFSIIPRLTDNEDIILRIIKATASDIQVNSSDGLKLKEQSLSTTVRVRPGETILLGGMFHDKDDIAVTKVPILGDLPALGWFFKREEIKTKKMEVIFAISPKVICNQI